MRTLVLSLGALKSSDNPVRPPDVATAARSHAAESRDQAVKDNQPHESNTETDARGSVPQVWRRGRDCRERSRSKQVPNLRPESN
jgi:hypothetical protein